MTGCSLLPEKQIQIQTKYIVQKPVILEPVQSPDIRLDPVIVVTAKDAEYYSEACEAFSEDFDDALVSYPGLDQDSACNWSVYGFTTQGWLNFEQQLILIEAYVKEVKSQLEFYKQQLQNQYDAVKEVD